MGRTYELYCKDCKQTLEVGRNDSRKEIFFTLYHSESHIDKLERFLVLHLGHHLVFDDSETIYNTCEDITEFMEESEELNDSLGVLNPTPIYSAIRVICNENHTPNNS